MTSTDRPMIGTAIVLVGRFNPAILHPSWLARFEILPPSDLDDDETEVPIVSPDFTLFKVGWLRIQATTDLFELSTTEQDRVAPLRDAGVNIFTQLSHTPVSALGINRTAHFPLEEGGWEAIRSALAPEGPWQAVAAQSTLNSLTVQNLRDGDVDDPGYVRATVEPSHRIDGGLFIGVNDHHEFAPSADEVGAAAPAVAVLESAWGDALALHEQYTRFLLDLAVGA